MLCVKHLRRTFSTATILAWSGLASVAGLLLAALLSRESLLPADSRGWLVLIALALVSQVAGQGLIAYAFAHLPVSFSSLSLLLQPAVAALTLLPGIADCFPIETVVAAEFLILAGHDSADQRRGNMVKRAPAACKTVSLGPSLQIVGGCVILAGIALATRASR